MKRFDPDAYGNPAAKHRSNKTISAQTSVPKALKVSCRNNVDIGGHEHNHAVSFINNGACGDPHALAAEVQKDKRAGTPMNGAHRDLRNSAFASMPSLIVHRSDKVDTRSPNQKVEFTSNTKNYPYMSSKSVEPSDKSAPDRGHILPQASTLLLDPNTILINHTICDLADASSNAQSRGSNEEANSVLVSTPERVAQNQPAFRMTQYQARIPSFEQTSSVSDSFNNSYEDRLSQARRDELLKISLRNKGRDRNVTASLENLALAKRKPASRSGSLTYGRAASAGGDVWPRTLLPGSLPPPQQFPANKRFKSRKDATNGEIYHKEHAHEPDQLSAVPGTDLKPVEFDAGSKASGSPIPSNASQASKDSVQPLRSAKVPHANNLEQLHPLAAWDGSIQPPPPAWNERSRFDSDPSMLLDECNKWTSDVIRRATDAYDGLFQTIPSVILQDRDICPDGISMVTRNTTITKENASHYGYNGEEAHEILKYVQPIELREFDSSWGKLDLTKPENFEIMHETTNDLVSNWMKNKHEHLKIVDAAMEAQEKANQALFEPVEAEPNPNQPKISLYIRAAIQSDASQMASIYNWYIEHGTRPAETSAVDEDVMLGRLDEVTSDRLPFIVAVERNTNSAIPHDFEKEVRTIENDSHPIKNIDPRHKSMKGAERIIGWACAQQFTAGDYVERITAEMEVYVDPRYRQLGVGNCLMDKLIEACDRGYMKRGGYDFFCPREHRHHYSGGGARDLHKLIFVLRKWKQPRDTIPPRMKPKHTKANSNRRQDDLENDYEAWLKGWMESWGFEVEGVLKGVGAKNGRFIDAVHLSRETRWQPAEGQVPDPMPGTF